MLNQFSRTQLLFGKEAMERLYNARVALAVLEAIRWKHWHAAALARWT